MSGMQKSMTGASMCSKCACGMPMKCMSKAWLSTIGSKCVKHTTNDQNMINIVIPKVWYSLKSKTTQKCHLGILSNTWYALVKLTCKQYMNMSENCLNTC